MLKRDITQLLKPYFMVQDSILWVINPPILRIFIILALGLFTWWRIQLENDVSGVKPAPPQKEQES
ncbi:MAG: hypothetical protein KBB16_00120 [Candidatus Pacebacteria bacterium]|nr:hypothetical protein [Candidatus Paceibacterota bacterium]